MTKLEEYKEGLKRRKVKLTDEEKQLVEELDDDMYTVEFLEDYSEYNDTKGPNALLLFMAAHGFRAAMSAIIRNRTERRGEVSNIRKRLFPVFEEIDRERKRQEEKWGEQNYRMLFNPHEFISTWLEPFREDNENKS
jgi:hypothetical protein